MTGDLAANQCLEDVKKRLAGLFKTNTETTGKLFNRKPVVVKKNADIETAKKYVRAITAAGAVCHIDPPQPNPEPPAEQPGEAPAEAASEHAEPHIIPIGLNNKPEERFAPRVLKKITASTSGLDLNTAEFSDIPFEQVTALSAFTVNEAISLLIFIRPTPQPFLCDIENISYPDFPVKMLPKTIASFRNFLFFLCRKNPDLVIEETTFDFLSGSTPQALNPPQPEKLATSMGKLLESGDVAAQT